MNCVMTVFFTVTKIHVHKYKFNQLFQKGAMFNFLGKKLRNFPQYLIADQVLEQLGVFISSSFFTIWHVKS